MQNWITSLTSNLLVSRVGRKAAVLGQLKGAGIPIPPGVCITTEAFQAARSTRTGVLSLPDGLLEALVRALPMQTPLAVRSSATLEDLAETSLAGRFITRLNVSGAAALHQAVLDCWDSAQHAPSVQGAGDMAVLIQPMVEAECAGVCFTVDPVRQRPDVLLVSSTWGLGAGVVSGAVPTDTARLRRIDLKTEEMFIADKHSAIRSATPNGVTRSPVAEDLRGVLCLPESWLQRVGQFGLAIEQLMGAPQDIEWAIMNGQLWILQSRPITALPMGTQEAVRFPVSWSNAEERCLYWWLEGENDGEVLLPAELDFMRLGVQGGQDAVYQGGKASTRQRKEVNGRTYMAADHSPHPPGHVRVYSAANRDLYERLAQQGVTWWEYWGPEVILATRRLASFNWREADGPALADHLEDATATAKRHWMIHTIVPGRPLRSGALLDRYAHLVDQPPGELASGIPFLLAGSETIQTRLVEALYDLACLALESPEIAQSIAVGNPLELPPHQPSMQAFAAALQSLITEYGDRLCYRKVQGFPVQLPLPWREAPDYVWEMIASYLPLARQGDQGLRQTRLEALGDADTRLNTLCAQALSAGKDPALVEDFRQKLAYARRNASFVDEHNHYIDQVSEGQYIQALLYAGRWLAALGRLPDVFDVFWLYRDEVLTALREPLASLNELISERRAKFGEWLSLIPPACLGLPDPQLPEREGFSSLPASKPEPIGVAANTLVGEPASRGRASGRARIITGDCIPADMASSDVIVAPFAGFQLIPFLPAAAAVVLDYGSPGDHFAITAREFGLPAVCATLHAVQRIPESAWVTVDGDTGLVTWTNSFG